MRLEEIIGRLRVAGCVCAEEEAQMLLQTASSESELAGLLDRRVSGVPIAHVVGWSEFCGLRIALDEHVFVPRPRTEFLVHQAVQRICPPAIVLDLCCGSGAVGIAAAALAGQVELHAVDIDPAAVRCAQRNMPIAGGRVYQGDLYKPLPAELKGRIDLLIANAPYVPSDEISLLPRDARLYEPSTALDGGADGLDIQRAVAQGAHDWLAPAGCVLIETGRHQAVKTAALFARSGLTTTTTYSEEFDATVVIGTL